MKKKVLFSFLIIIIIVIISTTIFAAGFDPKIMSGIGSDASKVKTIGGKILGIAQMVGMAVAVIMLLVIAIRFMIASASERAQLKEQLIPYVIGALLLFGASIFLGVASSIGAEINKLG